MTETLEAAAPLAIDDATADRLFRTARSVTEWTDAEVTDAHLRAAWDLAKFGPTAMNTLPLRFVVLRSDDAKARLLRYLPDGNRPKVEAAPATLVLAHDAGFHEHMPRLFPVYPGIREQLAPDTEARDGMARTNALIQAGYLIVALRSVGLSLRPMNGMDFDGVDAEFFADSGYRSFMMIAAGLTEGEGTEHPRLPRLALDEVAQIL
ncbi:malonic semialdehyde reductase [Myceligenerans pegani]|uniref:Malonic semialdehyde reductase n=1 Tax=Myceligenerans pegani TaxID=2776917 RepID=A0ABR9MSH9_9MICO|nr:malonic semialdehyde reductase [Myceligenerans sp. TRM 65318]MBE1874332.1 malonic semialdehyde reductase [Myceligenerans sp. TRM 65318]MBE3016603.1 malonic semialdehyde reductase [Myceligenerans sp. TRM 65318]